MPATDYTAARINMVEGQLRPNRLTDLRAVDAFLAVPRELFVPKALRGIAYVDEEIQVAPGRWLMEPMVLSRLIQELAIGAGDVVLDVGCASGYSSAVAGRMAGTVVALESDRDLAQTATRNLQAAGIDNALVMEGPLEAGWPKQAPYDVILLNGAVAEVPKALLDQLGEGGRLGAVVAPDGRLGQARLFQKLDGVVSSRVVFDASARILPGFEPRAGFVF